MSKSGSFISFPEGYLGARPQKFDLIADNEAFFAIAKPAGMACFQHEWSLGLPDISMALRRELLNGKPQLQRLGMKGLFRINSLDAEESGVLMYAKTVAAEESMKNAVGSRALTFIYHLLVDNKSGERELYCDLPIAKHFNESRMLVSHKTGKKCDTAFKFLRNFGHGFELWEASTSYSRIHQVRLHAAESDLSIAGESIYANGEKIYLSSLKKGFRGNRAREYPIYDALALHLVQVEFGGDFSAYPSVTAPLPGKFASLLKHLEGAGGRKW